VLVDSSIYVLTFKQPEKFLVSGKAAFNRSFKSSKDSAFAGNEAITKLFMDIFPIGKSKNYIHFVNA
jgi:hypothetical protein